MPRTESTAFIRDPAYIYAHRRPIDSYKPCNQGINPSTCTELYRFRQQGSSHNPMSETYETRMIPRENQIKRLAEGLEPDIASYADDPGPATYHGTECRILVCTLSLLYQHNRAWFWKVIKKEGYPEAMHEFIYKYFAYLEDAISDAMRMTISMGEYGRAASYVALYSICLREQGDQRRDRLFEFLKSNNILPESQLSAMARDLEYSSIINWARCEAVQVETPEQRGAATNINIDARRNQLVNELLQAVRRQDKEAMLNAFLEQEMPLLMGDTYRSRSADPACIDSYFVKHCNFNNSGVFNKVMMGIAPGNIMGVYFASEDLDGPFNNSTAHWIFLGVLQNEDGEYMYSIFDPLHGLKLSNDLQLQEATFNRFMRSYIGQQKGGVRHPPCPSVVVNLPLVFELSELCTKAIDYVRNGSLDTREEMEHEKVQAWRARIEAAHRAEVARRAQVSNTSYMSPPPSGTYNRPNPSSASSGPSSTVCVINDKIVENAKKPDALENLNSTDLSSVSNGADLSNAVSVRSNKIIEGTQKQDVPQNPKHTNNNEPSADRGSIWERIWSAIVSILLFFGACCFGYKAKDNANKTREADSGTASTREAPQPHIPEAGLSEPRVSTVHGDGRTGQKGPNIT